MTEFLFVQFFRNSDTNYLDTFNLISRKMFSSVLLNAMLDDTFHLKHTCKIIPEFLITTLNKTRGYLFSTAHM